MNFKDLAVSRSLRYSIGVEEDSGRYYLSIPVANSRIDYEEYYEITKKEFDSFRECEVAAAEFVEACRSRRMDHLLLIRPGAERGVPI